MLQVDISLLPDAWKKELSAYEQKASQALERLLAKECPSPEMTAWLNAPRERDIETYLQISKTIKNLPIAYDKVVVIGVGGSLNGTRAIYQALSRDYPNPRKEILVRWAGHHLSEVSLMDLLEDLEDSDPVLFLASKSGSTLEPSATFRVLEQWMQVRYGKDFSKRIFVASDAESSLSEFAKKHQYAKFSLHSGVGGRFSGLSPMTLAPLCMLGINGESLLLGADRLYASILDRSCTNVLTYAACRFLAWGKGFPLEALAYHEPKLQGLTEWWQQLFGESEGKQSKGLFPTSLMYTSALHSMGQYLQEGPLSVMQTFLEISKPSSGDPLLEKRIRIPLDERSPDNVPSFVGHYMHDINLIAFESARRAHAARGVPCVTLKWEELSPYSLGYLLAFFHVVCAIGGLMLDVNPFDQPGVEAYKKELQHRLLQHTRGERSP